MADTIIKSYNWFDGLLALIFLAGALRGYRNGLLRSIINLLTTIGAVAAAVFYHQPLAQLINENFSLDTKIAEFLTPRLKIPTMPLNESDPVAYLVESVSKLKLPQATIDFLSQKIESIGRINIQASAGNLGALVAKLLASLLITALAFLLIYLGVQILGRMLMFLLRSVLKVAGSWPDRLFGLAVGLLQAGALSVIFIAFIVPLLTSFGQGGLNDAVSYSFLANRLMNIYYKLLAVFSG